MVTMIPYDQGVPPVTYELLVSNREESRYCDFMDCVTEITWETRQAGFPAKLCFTVLKTANMGYWEGDKVKFLAAGKPLFVGYVFQKEKNDKGEIVTTCYDQLRYLSARQSYNFTGQSAADIIKKIAADFNLSCGALAATGYAIPSLIMDNQTCLDTICRALEMTLEATGRTYCFYDEGGLLQLTAATSLVTPYILGEESFAESYLYTTTINQGVYNSVKLVRPNSDTGLGDAYVVKSPTNIQKWGLLQYYKRVNQELNAAEIREMAKKMLLKDNRLKRTLNLHCLGIPEIRGGRVVKIELPTMGDLPANDYLTVAKALHRWDKNGYIMNLDFSLFREADTDYAYAMSEYSEYINVAQKKDSSGTGRVAGNAAASSGDSGGYRHPHHGTYRISTQFGKTGKAWKCGWHTGVDYVGISDKNIYAICRGTVAFAGTKASYGNCVMIQHPDGYLSLYAHLSSIAVKTGQTVTNGTIIGREGSTGNAFGSHLHLELHKGNYKYPPKPAINPETYILAHQ